MINKRAFEEYLETSYGNAIGYGNIYFTLLLQENSLALPEIEYFVTDRCKAIENVPRYVAISCAIGSIGFGGRVKEAILDMIDSCSCHLSNLFAEFTVDKALQSLLNLRINVGVATDYKDTNTYHAIMLALAEQGRLLEREILQEVSDKDCKVPLQAFYNYCGQ